MTTERPDGMPILDAEGLVEQLEIEREKVEDFRMKVLKLATWYGHDTEAALGELSPAKERPDA